MDESRFIPSNEWFLSIPELQEETTNDLVIISSDKEQIVLSCTSTLLKYSVFLDRKQRITLDRNTITLPFTAVVLNKIVEFADIYDKQPYSPFPTPLEESIETYLNTVYIVFLNSFTIQLLFETLNAGFYLNVDTLVELLSAKIASLMRERSPSEIEEIFAMQLHIPSDDV